MPAKSRKSSGDRSRSRRPHRGIDRPFDRRILSRAREIAREYRIVLETDPDGGFVGYPIELPYCFGGGATADACVASTREAATAVVAYMLEQGQHPPAAAREERRDQQVNIRLTAEERLLLEQTARQQGYRGLSDFVRSQSLAAVRR